MIEGNTVLDIWVLCTLVTSLVIAHHDRAWQGDMATWDGKHWVVWILLSIFFPIYYMGLVEMLIGMCYNKIYNLNMINWKAIHNSLTKPR